MFAVHLVDCKIVCNIYCWIYICYCVCKTYNYNINNNKNINNNESFFFIKFFQTEFEPIHNLLGCVLVWEKQLNYVQKDILLLN